ncbi:MAG: hypothetical protein HYR94_10920 [Chloroflexi bacterium]|nr:hypothetical protein [Chloroflexota bacterium]
MNNTKKRVDPIPDEFNSYEEAADFWDTHDTIDHPDAFETIEVEAEFRERRYEVERDEDVIQFLREKAHELSVTVNHLANDMLRQQIMSSG